MELEEDCVQEKKVGVDCESALLFLWNDNIIPIVADEMGFDVWPRRRRMTCNLTQLPSATRLIIEQFPVAIGEEENVEVQEDYFYYCTVGLPGTYLI